MAFVDSKQEVLRKSGRLAPKADAFLTEVPWRYFRWANLRDRILGAVLLVPALPVTLLLVLLVRLTSRGPGIYRQVRVGLGGRHFVMYKIRTMRNDAEAKTGPVWTTDNDPRITRVGHILRLLHLDEFPQLLNVFKGEMALIGPRPERPEFTQQLARDIHGYLNRLAVRPGITGLAQITLPPDSNLDSVRRKLAVDLAYIQHAGVGLDFRILLRTFLRLVGIRGDAMSFLLGLRNPPDLDAAVRGPAAENGTHWARSLHSANGNETAKSGVLPSKNGASHDASRHNGRSV
jgi:lipopolysaccharide/colanic/teichoic acid biosynthesis glycosyltransferase